MTLDPATLAEVEPARPTSVVNPSTGELVPLDAPPSDLAQTVEAIRDWESQARQAKRLISDELHRQMDRDRNWTIRENGITIRGKSDEPISEWDIPALVQLLDRWTEEGVITADAASAAVQPVMDWKIKQAGINRLRKNPKLSAALDECRSLRDPENRTISISRL